MDLIKQVDVGQAKDNFVSLGFGAGAEPMSFSGAATGRGYPRQA